MKHRIRWSIAALATLLLLAASFKLGRRLQINAQQSAAVPFTVFMVEKLYAAGQDEPVNVVESIVATRSDGSIVTVKRYPSPDNSGNWVQPRVLLDVPGKRRISIDPRTESLLIYPMTDAGLAVQRTWQKSFCADRSNLQRSTLLGYEVLKVQAKGPEELEERTMWMAPKLDCFPLRETHTAGPPSGPTQRTAAEALFVIEGEPSPSLFKVPEDYAERTVAEFFQEWERRYPGQPIGPERTKQVLIEAYQAAQSNR